MTVLRAGPDRDVADRGPDAGVDLDYTIVIVHPQHATGRPCLGPDRVLHGGGGRGGAPNGDGRGVRRHAADLHQSVRPADGGLRDGTVRMTQRASTRRSRDSSWRSSRWGNRRRSPLSTRSRRSFTATTPWPKVIVEDDAIDDSTSALIRDPGTAGLADAGRGRPSARVGDAAHQPSPGAHRRSGRECRQT